MRVEFRITGGTRAGQAESFEKPTITIGRHPTCDLRFDAERDTDVSTRHAELTVDGSTVTLRDIGSTNGTLVNGQAIHGAITLFAGDVVSFGAHGPTVEIRGEGLAARPATAPRRDTTARIAEAVEAQTGWMRKMVSVLVVVVVLGVASALWIGNRGAAAAEKQIQALTAQNDSISKALEQTLGALKGKSSAVDAALAAARQEADQLRARLQQGAASGDAAAVAALTSDIQTATSRRQGLIGAAQVDWAAVHDRNAPAMVLLVVDFGDDKPSSGTGFNVSPSGLVVTNRHVVRDEAGRLAKRVVARFENTTVPFKLVEIVKVSETDELAWLKIGDGGRYPVVQGVARNCSARVGAPVALIGYPLGTGTAGMGGNINDIRPASTQTLGSVRKVIPDILRLDIYAAQGSSGSPVFDSAGLVCGVLYGSPTESNGRIIYSVPAAKLVAQMPAEGAASIR
ncbi:MAG: FHA domain-containing protein [Gemmatimonadetes bacterium]|nr:FHA domain-containing protein [Gemmatimonadota bacterium]